MEDHDAMDAAVRAVDMSMPSGEREPEILKSSYVGILLICGDCEQRSSGPRKFDSKEVRKRLKDVLRPVKGRLRVATTGCLGPCPKKAMTVAVAADGTVSMKALCRADQVDAVGAAAVASIMRGEALQPEG